jgi:hypothetical protein
MCWLPVLPSLPTAAVAAWPTDATSPITMETTSGRPSDAAAPLSSRPSDLADRSPGPCDSTCSAAPTTTDPPLLTDLSIDHYPHYRRSIAAQPTPHHLQLPPPITSPASPQMSRALLLAAMLHARMRPIAGLALLPAACAVPQPWYYALYVPHRGYAVLSSWDLCSTHGATATGAPGAVHKTLRLLNAAMCRTRSSRS